MYSKATKMAKPSIAALPLVSSALGENKPAAAKKQAAQAERHRLLAHPSYKNLQGLHSYKSSHKRVLDKQPTLYE